MNEYCANLLKNKIFVNSLQQSIGEKQVEAGIMYRALRSALLESINDSSLTLMKKTFDFFIQEGIIEDAKEEALIFNSLCAKEWQHILKVFANLDVLIEPTEELIYV